LRVPNETTTLFLLRLITKAIFISFETNWRNIVAAPTWPLFLMVLTSLSRRRNVVYWNPNGRSSMIPVNWWVKKNCSLDVVCQTVKGLSGCALPFSIEAMYGSSRSGTNFTSAHHWVTSLDLQHAGIQRKGLEMLLSTGLAKATNLTRLTITLKSDWWGPKSCLRSLWMKLAFIITHKEIM